MTSYFIVYFLFLGFIAIILTSLMTPITKQTFVVLLAALVFRLLMTGAYYHLVITSGGDAPMYFGGAKHLDGSQGHIMGTYLVYAITQGILAVTQYFPEAFLTTFIPFSLIGFCGSLFLFFALRKIVPPGSVLPELSLFFPSVVFWSSNIGKDSLVLFGLGMFVFFLVDFPRKRSLISLIFPMTLIFLVRPHIGAGLFASLSVSIFLHGGLNMRKLLYGFMSVAFVILIIGPTLTHLGMRTDLSLYDQVIQRIEFSADYYVSKSAGSSAQRSTEFSILFAPWYILSFLASPFIWESVGWGQLAASLDGMVYVFACLLGISAFRRQSSERAAFWAILSIVVILCFGVLLGAALTNFGLVSRQRTMVYPFVLLLLAMYQKCKYERTNS